MMYGNMSHSLASCTGTLLPSFRFRFGWLVWEGEKKGGIGLTHDIFIFVCCAHCIY